VNTPALVGGIKISKHKTAICEEVVGSIAYCFDLYRVDIPEINSRAGTHAVCKGTWSRYRISSPSVNISLGGKNEQDHSKKCKYVPNTYIIMFSKG
jgi:hypothetical protein